jgi:nondiscriminating glutamyl-tRNA synthetase
VFDEERLRWLNAIYIRSLAIDDLLQRLRPFLSESGYAPEKLDALWLKKVVETVKDELTTLADAGSHIELFFDDHYEITPDAKLILDAEKSRKVVKAFGEYLSSAADSPQEIYAAAIKYAKEKSGVKGRDLFLPVRAALTGKLKGPELDRVFAILGRDSACKRLQWAEKACL